MAHHREDIIDRTIRDFGIESLREYHRRRKFIRADRRVGETRPGLPPPVRADAPAPVEAP